MVASDSIPTNSSETKTFHCKMLSFNYDSNEQNASNTLMIDPYYQMPILPYTIYPEMDTMAEYIEPISPEHEDCSLSSASLQADQPQPSPEPGQTPPGEQLDHDVQQPLLPQERDEKHLEHSLQNLPEMGKQIQDSLLAQAGDEKIHDSQSPLSHSEKTSSSNTFVSFHPPPTQEADAKSQSNTQETLQNPSLPPFSRQSPPVSSPHTPATSPSSRLDQQSSQRLENNLVLDHPTLQKPEHLPHPDHACPRTPHQAPLDLQGSLPLDPQHYLQGPQSQQTHRLIPSDLALPTQTKHTPWQNARPPHKPQKQHTPHIPKKQTGNYWTKPFDPLTPEKNRYVPATVDNINWPNIPINDKKEELSQYEVMKNETPKQKHQEVSRTKELSQDLMTVIDYYRSNLALTLFSILLIMLAYAFFHWYTEGNEKHHQELYLMALASSQIIIALWGNKIINFALGLKNTIQEFFSNLLLPPDHRKISQLNFMEKQKVASDIRAVMQCQSLAEKLRVKRNYRVKDEIKQKRAEKFAASETLNKSGADTISPEIIHIQSPNKSDEQLCRDKLMVKMLVQDTLISYGQIDSGSQLSLISSKFYGQLKRDSNYAFQEIHEGNLTIKGIGSELEHSTPRVLIKLQIGKCTFVHKFLVTDYLEGTNLLLGLDLIKSKKLFIKPRENGDLILTVGDFEAPLTTVPLAMSAKSVSLKLQEDIDIQPLSCHKISIDISSKKELSPWHTFLPLQVKNVVPKSPIYIQEKLITLPQEQSLSLAIHNDTSSIVQLPEGWTVAKLDTMDKNAIFTDGNNFLMSETDIFLQNIAGDPEISMDTGKKSNDEIRFTKVGIEEGDLPPETVLEPSGFEFIHPSELKEPELKKLLINEEIPQQFRQDLVNYIRNETPDIISKSEFDIGDCQVIQHEIKLTSDKPAACRPYRTQGIRLSQLKAAISQLEQAGMIKMQDSDYASACYLIGKRPDPGTSGERQRLIVNYKPLNSLTRKSTFPLVDIQTLFNQLSGKRFFTALDIRSGFQSISVEKNSQRYSAFITPWGTYCCLRMPFGLSGAPSCFVHAMSIIFKGMPNIHFYMDDILICSETEEEMVDLLKQVFAKIQEHGLKIVPSKATYFSRKLKWLGNIISGLGKQPDPAKIQGIKNMPLPTSTKDVQIFMGHLAYICSFIPNYSEMTSSISELLKQKVFKMTDEATEAFYKIKDVLSTKMILYHPRFDKDLILQSDASHNAIGGLIYQAFRYTKDTKGLEEMIKDWDYSLEEANNVVSSPSYILPPALSQDQQARGPNPFSLHEGQPDVHSHPHMHTSCTSSYKPQQKDSHDSKLLSQQFSSSLDNSPSPFDVSQPPPYLSAEGNESKKAKFPPYQQHPSLDPRQSNCQEQCLASLPSQLPVQPQPPSAESHQQTCNSQAYPHLCPPNTTDERKRPNFQPPFVPLPIQPSPPPVPQPSFQKNTPSCFHPLTYSHQNWSPPQIHPPSRPQIRPYLPPFRPTRQHQPPWRPRGLRGNLAPPFPLSSWPPPPHPVYPCPPNLEAESSNYHDKWMIQDHLDPKNTNMAEEHEKKVLASAKQNQQKPENQQPSLVTHESTKLSSAPYFPRQDFCQPKLSLSTNSGDEIFPAQFSEAQELGNTPPRAPPAPSISTPSGQPPTQPSAESPQVPNSQVPRVEHPSKPPQPQIFSTEARLQQEHVPPTNQKPKLISTIKNDKESSDHKKLTEEYIYLFRPISFYSKKLTDTQRTLWAIYEKECYALLNLLLGYEDYLYAFTANGRKNYVILDNQVLIYSFKFKSGPNNKLSRWVTQILALPYDIIINYVPSNRMGPADYLSRMWAPPAESDDTHSIHPRKAIQISPLFDPGTILSIPSVLKKVRENPDCLIQQKPKDGQISTVQKELYQSQMADTKMLSHSQECNNLNVKKFIVQCKELQDLLTMDNITRHQRMDQKLIEIITKLENGEKYKQYYLYKGLLKIPNKYKAVDYLGRTVIPEYMRSTVLALYHVYNHSGGKKLLSSLEQLYFWDNMKTDVQKFCNACILCSTHKHTVQRRVKLGHLKKFNLLEAWTIDFVDGLKRIDNKTSFLNCVECFSGYTISFPVASKETTTAAILFEKNVICRFGPPKHIIMDNAKTFHARLFRTTMDRYNTKLHFTTRYRPESHSLVEISNKNVQTILRILCTQYKSNWIDMLPLANMVLNMSNRPEMLNKSPHDIMFGTQLSWAKPELIKPDDYIDPERELEKLIENRLVALTAVDNLYKAREKRNGRFPQGNIDFPPGTLIYVKDNRSLELKKIQQRYFSSPTEVLADLGSTVLHRNILGLVKRDHKSNIKKCEPRTTTLFADLPLQIKLLLGGVFDADTFREFYTLHELPSFITDRRELLDDLAVFEPNNQDDQQNNNQDEDEETQDQMNEDYEIFD